MNPSSKLTIHSGVYTASQAPQHGTVPSDRVHPSTQRREGNGSAGAAAKGHEVDRQHAYSLVDDPLRQQVEYAVGQVLKQHDIQLAFEYDKETGQMYIALRDARTGKIVRQIPPEEQLRWSKRIEAFLQRLNASSSSGDKVETARGLLLSTRA